MEGPLPRLRSVCWVTMSGLTGTRALAGVGGGEWGGSVGRPLLWAVAAVVGAVVVETEPGRMPMKRMKRASGPSEPSFVFIRL